MEEHTNASPLDLLGVLLGVVGLICGLRRRDPITIVVALFLGGRAALAIPPEAYRAMGTRFKLL